MVYIIMTMALIAGVVIGGYGLLKLGRMLNELLLEPRGLRWVTYVAGVIGLAMLGVGYLGSMGGEWMIAIGALFFVLGLVSVLNYKGK